MIAGIYPGIKPNVKNLTITTKHNKDSRNILCEKAKR